jgi:hypothetical protein
MLPSSSSSSLLLLLPLLLAAPDPARGCIGAPGNKCPVWPREFSAPFGLHSGFPWYIKNASSMFYYKFLENGTQAQLVDYQQHCFPLVNAKSSFESKPCKLYFEPKGIFLSQPAHGVDCCTFVSGVGAVPPTFLQAYTYKSTDQMAPDLYGAQVSCDYWEGPEGFKYWTVGHDDAKYKNWGHDIVFQDGPTGVTWRWGGFTVEPQDDSTFQLPGTDEECAKTCSKVLSVEEHDALTEHVQRFYLNGR